MKSPHHIAGVIVGLLVLLAACVGIEEVSDFVPPTDETHPVEVVDQGRGLYLRYCTSCHAADGSGGVGANIRQVWERLGLEEETSLVAEGRGQMPKFNGTLTPEEIEAVVAYTRVGW